MGEGAGLQAFVSAMNAEDVFAWSWALLHGCLYVVQLETYDEDEELEVGVDARRLAPTGWNELDASAVIPWDFAGWSVSNLRYPLWEKGSIHLSSKVGAVFGLAPPNAVTAIQHSGLKRIHIGWYRSRQPFMLLYDSQVGGQIKLYDENGAVIATSFDLPVMPLTD